MQENIEDRKNIKDSSSGQHRQGGPGESVQQKTPMLQGFSYITRKAEKLTTALYMVTDILGDKEPLKWKAREAGVELLSDITVAGAASASERMSILRATLKKIERVVSFIDIAASARMITEMNSGVLKKEYLLLRDNVEAEWTNTHDRSRQMLTERFFDVPRDLPEKTFVPTQSFVGLVEKTQPEHTLSLQKSNIPNVHVAARVEPENVAPVQSFVRQSPTPKSEPERVAISPRQILAPIPKPLPEKTFSPEQSFVGSPEKTFLPTQSFVGRQNIIVDREIASHSRSDYDRDDRRKIILALLKQKPSVIVGDIAKSIPGVSEKTIQRELLSMVAEGILVKRGERRWSTYSLAV